VTAATQSLIGKVDAIYIPNDNTVISALDSVIKVTHAEKIPVFSSDPESVERGCLATIAPDQYQIGRQAGRLVGSLLKGTEINKVNPEKASALVFILNQKTARHLGVTFPHTLLEKADKIIELDGTITTNSQKGRTK
jgi:putative ABC transport system substrate-binding protein